MALLDKVLQRGPAPAGTNRADPEPAEMTLIEHLEDLRKTLIWALGAWVVATLICLLPPVWRSVVEFLVRRGGVTEAYYTAPTGAFVLALKLAATMGFIAAFPVIAQRIWWFVSPGLHRHERRLVLPLFLATILFFALGVAFSIVALPLFVKILTGFAPPDLRYLPFVDQYIGFVMFLALGFGIVFELPVVIYVLGRFGIVSSKSLYSKRPHWILGLGLAANFLTPGADPLTPLIMFIPLYLFWEGAVLVLKLTGR